MGELLTVMKEVEEVKAKKKAIEDEYHAAISHHTVQQQKLRACEVCGAFLSMYDNDRCLADHFGCKVHIGFVTIREKIKQLEVRWREMFSSPVDYMPAWHSPWLAFNACVICIAKARVGKAWYL